MKINIQGEAYQKKIAYEPMSKWCPQEKNLSNGGEWIMNDNINGFVIDNNIVSVMKENSGNRFLEIKEGQEIDIINKKYNDDRQEIIKSDRIQQIILDLEQRIKDIYIKENRETEFVPIFYNKYTKETTNKVKELTNARDNEIKKIKMKYAEVAALVEDIPAKDRIEIYKEYDIM